MDINFYKLTSGSLCLKILCVVSVVECKIWVESAVDCSMSRTVSQLFTCDLVTGVWSWHGKFLTVIHPEVCG